MYEIDVLLKWRRLIAGGTAVTPWKQIPIRVVVRCCKRAGCNFIRVKVGDVTCGEVRCGDDNVVDGDFRVGVGGNAGGGVGEVAIGSVSRGVSPSSLEDLDRTNGCGGGDGQVVRPDVFASGDEAMLVVGDLGVGVSGDSVVDAEFTSTGDGQTTSCRNG